MISLDIPGSRSLRLSHLVLDYNGTIALDGVLLPGVEQRIERLAGHLDIHIITADTFNSCRTCCSSIWADVHVLAAGEGALQKELFVESLGVDSVAAIGNGVNDCRMLSRSALGIAVVGAEGAAVNLLQSADIVVMSITDGLDLLLNPGRITATLRG